MFYKNRFLLNLKKYFTLTANITKDKIKMFFLLVMVANSGLGVGLDNLKSKYDQGTDHIIDTRGDSTSSEDFRSTPSWYTGMQL